MAAGLRAAAAAFRGLCRAAAPAAPAAAAGRRGAGAASPALRRDVRLLLAGTAAAAAAGVGGGWPSHWTAACERLAAQHGGPEPFVPGKLWTALRKLRRPVRDEAAGAADDDDDEDDEGWEGASLRPDDGAAALPAALAPPEALWRLVRENSASFAAVAGLGLVLAGLSAVLPMAMTRLYDVGPLFKDLQLSRLRDLLQHQQGRALLAQVGEALAAMAGAAVARGFAVSPGRRREGTLVGLTPRQRCT